MHRFRPNSALSTTCTRWIAAQAALLLVASVATPLIADSETDLTPRVSVISPGPGVQYELQAILIDAVPGDVIEFEAGRYELFRQLDIATSNLTLRGKGSDQTILSFSKQDAGGAGIEATGDNFLIEGLAIEDTAGNAIKTLGATGVTFRDVRTEWTGPAAETNGAYGIYPVQCHNVLIEKCTAIGASDAGLYVGQCHNVIVRSSRAERNVAGIEIENTIGADVYDNTATNNTGGILVFDLPGLQVNAGRDVRVYKNSVFGNNHPNFAAKGNIVAGVPPGTGVLVLAMDRVEVFDNDITDHQTTGIAIRAYTSTGKRPVRAGFDPYPESISIHDNRITNSGFDPAGEIGLGLKPYFSGALPDILWCGTFDPANLRDGKPTAEQIPSIKNNGGATFANFDRAHLNPEDIAAGRHRIDRDLALVSRDRAPLAAITLPPPKPARAGAAKAVQVYRSAKKRLSDYGLFSGKLADHIPAAGVVPYDLNTPLFSDYTTKDRFIRLPEGGKVEYRKEGVLEFPVGTVIAKTFSYPHDMTDPSQGRQLLETRIELRNDDGWYGFSYLWNEEQSDADLVLGGSEVAVNWTHSDGKPRSNQYQIPNAVQCLNCHQTGDNFQPIGPVAANLNRDFEYPHGSQNQLAFLNDNHLISGMPSHGIQAWPAFDDVHGASVNERARTWLHVNCAHCHSPGGTARTSGLDLRLTQNDHAKLGYFKPPVAAGHGSGGREFDIVPGKPDESILMYRVESTDPSIAMPNVSKRMVSVEAAALVRRWISELKE